MLNVSFASKPPEPDAISIIYEGDITISASKIPIAMYLIFKGNKITGMYSFFDSTRDRMLEGTITRSGGDMTLELYEISEQGKKQKRFVGKLMVWDPRGYHVNHPHPELGVIVGKWYDSETQRPYEFYLTLKGFGETDNLDHIYYDIDSDEAIHKIVQTFKNAVRSNDKETVASMIRYPIKVSIGGEFVVISDKSQLITSYDKIFYDRYQQLILQARGRYLKRSIDEDFSLGNGYVWFNPWGEIIVLNNFRY
ncbi:MAG: hypothetical protein V4485_06580 [Pseudomonadota bacterium]